MKEIIKGKHLYFDGSNSVVRIKIHMDTADELPTATEFSGKKLAMGSIAWVISTGDIYALDSNGNWQKQAISGGSVNIDSITNAELEEMWGV